MKFLVYSIVSFLFILNGTKANNVANSLIQESCKNATVLREPSFFNFCVASIKDNPESKKVRNSHELNLLACENAVLNMTKVKRLVDKYLKEKKYKSGLAGKMLRRCAKLYSEGIHLTTKSLEYVKLRDYIKADDELMSKAVFPLRECEMGFNDYNKLISPVAKESEVCLNVVEVAMFFVFEVIQHLSDA